VPGLRGETRETDMKVQKARAAMAWPWMITAEAGETDDPGEILGQIKDERLARQFAESDKVLAMLKLMLHARNWIINGKCVYCGGERDGHNVDCEIVAAREVVQRVEG